MLFKLHVWPRVDEQTAVRVALFVCASAVRLFCDLRLRYQTYAITAAMLSSLPGSQVRLNHRGAMAWIERDRLLLGAEFEWNTNPVAYCHIL